MATRQEVIVAIRDGIERVEATFGTLTDEQLATAVHEGDGGWTAGQILAHMAGRAEGHQMLLSMATGAAPGGFGGFDVNQWNQQKVDERADRSRDELLQEFRQVHEALIQNLTELPDGAFETMIPSPRGGEIALGEMLAGSGGQHNIAHTVEVERALGLSREAS